MDPIQQLCQKLAAEQTHQSLRQRPTIPTIAPPPYTPSDTDSDADSDTEDDTLSSPLKLTINAAHSIQGSNNLVPTSPTPLADATKFSTLLLAAVNQISGVTDATRAKRRLKVDLTINCGITVIGDRNVVGNVGLKPKSAAQAVAGPGAVAMSAQAASAVAGAKRKAEDEDVDEEPEAKRVALHDSESE